MQSLLAELTKLPLWLLIFGLTCLAAIAWYWVGQLSQHVRIPKPSARVLSLIKGYVISALLAWCATTFIRSGFSEAAQDWNETHRLLFMAISIYLTPHIARHLGSDS